MSCGCVQQRGSADFTVVAVHSRSHYYWVTLISVLSSPFPSAVFTYNKLLVVIAELQGEDKDALDIVPVIITALLEEHQVVAGIVVVVDPNTIPINSRGEKQRVHLRDTFLADELDPIFAAYNL